METLNEKIERIVKDVINEEFAFISNSRVVLTEMATFGVQKWGNETYKIAVHGSSTKDRPTPHIHIYLNNDVNPYSKFNIEVSLVDLLCSDAIVPIYQHDAAHNVLNTNRRDCSWTNYNDILKGLIEFFKTGPISTKFGSFENNIERAIYEWNRETDFQKTEKGGNPLKEYFESKGLVPLSKYAKYLKDKEIVIPSDTVYKVGDFVNYHSFIYNGENKESKVEEKTIDDCLIVGMEDNKYKLYDTKSKTTFDAYNCDVEKTKKLENKI